MGLLVCTASQKLHQSKRSSAATSWSGRTIAAPVARPLDRVLLLQRREPETDPLLYEQEFRNCFLTRAGCDEG